MNPEATQIEGKVEVGTTVEHDAEVASQKMVEADGANKAGIEAAKAAGLEFFGF